MVGEKPTSAESLTDADLDLLVSPQNLTHACSVDLGADLVLVVAGLRKLRVRDEAASLALETLAHRVVELEADNAMLKAALEEIKTVVDEPGHRNRAILVEILDAALKGVAEPEVDDPGGWHPPGCRCIYCAEPAEAMTPGGKTIAFK